MSRGIELQLLLGDNPEALSLGGFRLRDAPRAIDLLFATGAVMDAEGNWFRPEAVAFCVGPGEPYVLVYCADYDDEPPGEAPKNEALERRLSEALRRPRKRRAAKNPPKASGEEE